MQMYRDLTDGHFDHPMGMVVAGLHPHAQQEVLQPPIQAVDNLIGKDKQTADNWNISQYILKVIEPIQYSRTETLENASFVIIASLKGPDKHIKICWYACKPPSHSWCVLVCFE